MKTVRTISINNAKFHAFHGVLPFEREVGGDYLVSVTVDYDWSGCVENDDLDKTINYAVIYDIVKDVMSRPKKLIETVCGEISDRISESIEGITRLQVRLKKLSPPLPGEIESSEVSVDIIY